MLPRALVLHATGTNRDLEAAEALRLAGAEVEIVHLNQLRQGERRLSDYQLLALPGGFSYADALSAGKLLALDLTAYFVDQVSEFVESGKAVIGICNGFQALVKAGLLPFSRPGSLGEGGATLTFNESGHFECRWVTLAAVSQLCLWTRDLQELVYCPVAHGEGRFVLAEPGLLSELEAKDQLALVYTAPDGSPAAGAYPHNPNGSTADVAGVCNRRGNVLGLMPHPENHLYPYQHPRWARGECGGLGLNLFINGVTYAAQS